ncbi:MAG: hypothetical protein WCW52_11415 [Elusimicrobiales bacterium]|jgi:hypothetical protein
MSDLPEINFREQKKKEKKGFIPWVRSKLGFGGKGYMGGAGEAAPGAANFGRAAFGAAKLGTAAGMGGFGGVGGLIAAAVVVAAIGTTLYMRSPSDSVNTRSFSSDKTADNYVPAILRETKNQGSSLEMFKDTNKGVISADGYDDAGYDKNGYDRDGYDKDGYDKNGLDRNGASKNAPEDKAAAQNPEPVNAGQDMAKKLAGGLAGGLSSSMGGAGGQFSNMGGFGNKFNTGATGGQSSGFSSLGSGFQTSPKFDQRKKLLGMKGSTRPVFSKSKGGKPGVIGKGAFAQAKGVKAMQQTTVGNSADHQRSTQDKAWEGSTPLGTATGGTGIANKPNGGAGIVTSPSIDNTSGGGHNPINGNPTNPTNLAGTTPTSIDVSPWKGLPQMAMMLIMFSALASVIGAMVIDLSYDLLPPFDAIVYAIGIMICVVAMALAAMAIMIGIKLMSTYGQGMLGSIYTIGGGVAMTAAGMAMGGSMTTIAGISATWMAAIAGILGLLGSMAGGK